MLEWRQSLKIDEIREKIISNNWSMKQFPHFDKIVYEFLIDQHHFIIHQFYLIHPATTYSKMIPFCHLYDHHDKEGNVISFERTGQINVLTLLRTVSEEELVEFYLYLLEYHSIQLNQQSRECKKLIRTTLVRDFQVKSCNSRCVSCFFTTKLYRAYQLLIQRHRH